MTRSRLVLIALGLALAFGAAAALALRDGDETRRSADARAAVARCRGLIDETGRECLAREFLALLDGRDDARPVVDAIENEAWRSGGFVLSNCHGVMHTVGRTYARDVGVTLATLRDHLPQSNDPACAAGFAHGVVTAVAPQLDLAYPARAAATCRQGTRYQRYSCVHGLGHAFMRVVDGALSPALDLCKSIGREAPDCAQGAFHDYWFGVAGVDEAPTRAGAQTDPRVLCGAQAPEFVRPCWYRAFVDNRPAGFVVESAADVRDLCDGLAGVQRSGCVTAASVIGPADPMLQLELCRDLSASDAVDCIRGTKAQNLIRDSPSARVDLIRHCDVFRRPTREACYRWLGKTLTVITDGTFVRTGCAGFVGDPQRWCRAGARSIDGPLVTFS